MSQLNVANLIVIKWTKKCSKRADYHTKKSLAPKKKSFHSYEEYKILTYKVSQLMWITKHIMVDHI